MSDQNLPGRGKAGVAHTPRRGPPEAEQSLDPAIIGCFSGRLCCAFHLERTLPPAHTEQPICILPAPVNKGKSLKTSYLRLPKYISSSKEPDPSRSRASILALKCLWSLSEQGRAEGTGAAGVE